jgi:lipoyl(octanoyl) transferase
MSGAAVLLRLGLVGYEEAWELQRAVAAEVLAGELPDTVLLLEHPPTVTLGRRTDPGELHIPDDAAVTVIETDRGGRSTYHAPGQLVCYPILDLNRHGRDVRGYCRALEAAIIATLARLELPARGIEGLTGVWVDSRGGAPAKIASIGVHIRRWVTTHGYALNVALDPTPFSEWITACGLEDASFTTVSRELGRPVTVEEVAGHAAAALGEVFGLALVAPSGEPARELPAELRSRLDSLAGAAAERPVAMATAGAGRPG